MWWILCGPGLLGDANATPETPLDQPAEAAAPATPTPPRSVPTDYAPRTLDGTPLDFREFRGKPLMVNIWASWCAPCIKEMPQLVALNARYQPQGLNLVGIAVDDQDGKVKRVIKRHHIDWSIAMDESDRVSRLFEIDELPATFVYWPDGTVAWSKVGRIEEDDPILKEILEQVIAAGSP